MPQREYSDGEGAASLQELQGEDANGFDLLVKLVPPGAISLSRRA